MLFDEDPQVDDVIVYQAVATDDVSAVVIKTCVDGLDYRAEGSAKRHPKDTPNRSLGITLAAARAFLNLSHQLLDEANLQLDDPGYDFPMPIPIPALKEMERLAHSYGYSPNIYGIDTKKFFDPLHVTEDGSVT
jgi:hypothetical protein